MKNSFNPWPLGIVLVFVVFIAGMAAAVFIASTHSDALVARDYYEQELVYQTRMEAVARADQSGALLSHDAAGRKIWFRLPASQRSKSVSGVMELYRPSAAEQDRSIALAPQADGSQAVDISQLAPGAWAVRVSWTSAGEKFFIEQKIKI